MLGIPFGPGIGKGGAPLAGEPAGGMKGGNGMPRPAGAVSLSEYIDYWGCSSQTYEVESRLGDLEAC